MSSQEENSVEQSTHENIIADIHANAWNIKKRIVHFFELKHKKGTSSKAAASPSTSVQETLKIPVTSSQENHKKKK